MSEVKDVGVKDDLGVGGAEEEVVEGTGEDGESHVAVEPAPGAKTVLFSGDNNRADGDDKGDGEEESLMTNNSDEPNEDVAEEVRAVDEEGGVGLMGRTNSEMEGTGDGVGENLGERKECEKGSDENGLGEDLGGIASAINGDDSGNHKEDSGKGVVSDHVENIDEAKENIVEEANLDGQGDTVKAEETLSGQVKTEDKKHNGECTENVEVRTQIETEEEVEKKMDIDEAEAVQSKEDIELKPLHEGNKLITEHLTEENGSMKSLVFDFNSLDGDDSGEEDEQSVFMQELENFFKERNLEFKPPKFYGEGLNCLKLWRAVIRLGGYDQVTTCKLWRQVGESFNPPKTCTTISWSFRCFYEKALLDYERYMVQTGELQFPPTSFSLPSGAENQVGSSQPGGSGRARRDAAARAMQGWHSQRLVGNEEEKSSAALSKREKQLKTLNVGKRKRQSSDEQAVRVARTKMEDQRDGQAGSPVSVKEISIKDIGPAAEWVKINVRKNAECWEVYALVPGLLREEVRVQSDPAGCLVISGEPEQPDNPWGVHPFKKVITLPSRINPHQTSAVVTLHGQLFVRAPFEQ